MRSDRSPWRLLAAGLFAALATLAPGYDLIRDGQTGKLITWNSGSIPIVIRMAQTPSLQDGTNYATSVQAAMQTWNGQLANIQFAPTITEPGTAADNGINEIVFASQIYGDAQTPPEDFGPNVLAVTLSYRSQSPRGNGTFQRLESDIIFNAGVPSGWNSYRGSLQQPEDIRRVAIHELGHVIGLDHPDEAGQSVAAIMNSTVSNVDSLLPDDIMGAQFQYGRPGGFIEPGNNNFANALFVTLSGNTASVTLSSAGATKEPGEPNHAPDEPGGASVWWKWTATGNGSLTVTTAGSHFDTLLAAYTGSSVGSLTQLAANDDVTRGVVRTSTVTIDVTNGTTYFFALDGWEGEWGNYRLNFTFTPTPSGSPPQFATHPVNYTASDGTHAYFHASLASAQSGTTLQWQRLPVGAGAWQDIAPDATYNNPNGTYLTVFRVTMAMSGEQFRCVATNAVGATASNPATLTVTPSAPIIITSPSSVDVMPGNSVTFSVTVAGTPPFTYQWLKNWSSIPGATGSTLTLGNITANDAGSYSVVVSNAQGSTSSSSAQLTVVTAPPFFTQQPRSVAVMQGESASLSVSITTQGTTRFQWYRNGVALSGETSPHISLYNATTAQAGDYHVTATNVAGTTSSATATVEILPLAPPRNLTLWGYFSNATLGGSLSLFVNSPANISSGGYTFQRYRDGNPIPGATSLSLNVSNMGPADFGDYYLAVTNAAGTGLSSVYRVHYDTWANRNAGDWLSTQEADGVVYFLFADQPRIARFDLATETWLSSWSLPEMAMDFLVTPGGIYLAHANRLAKYSRDFIWERDVAGVRPEKFMAHRPGQMLVLTVSGGTEIVTVDLTTDAVLERRRAEYSSAYTYSYSPAHGRVYAGSYAHAAWHADGAMAAFVFAENPTGLPQSLIGFVVRDGQELVDRSGIVRSGAGLAHRGNLGGPFQSLVELDERSLGVLRVGTLTVYNAANREVGSVAFPTRVVHLVRKGAEVVGFSNPAATGQLPGVSKVALANMVPPSRPAVLDPVNRTIAAPEFQTDGWGNIYVHSRNDRTVFRWSAYEGRYTGSYQLAAATDMWAVAPEQGGILYNRRGYTLRRVDLGHGGDTHHYTTPEPIRGMAAVGRNALTVDDTGSWSSHTTLSSRGDFLFWAEWNHYSRTYVWSPAVNRLYFFSDDSSPNDLLYESISVTGEISGRFDSPYHGEVNVAMPLRVSADGQHVLLGGSGEVYHAQSLQRIGRLPVNVTDGTWIGGTLHTVRETAAGAAVTTWNSGLTAVRTATFPGRAAALFTIPGDYLVLITVTADVPTFRVLSPDSLAEVNLASSNTAPVILRQPASVSTTVRQRATFAVAANGGVGVSYEWRRNGVALANGNGISGATSAMLVLDEVTETHRGNYDVVVRNAAGAVTSDAAVLDVTVPNPVIRQQPAAAIVGPGRTHVLVTEAFDVLPLTYQWFRDDVAVPGATGPTLRLTDFSSLLSGSYHVVVANGVGTTRSTAVTVVLASRPAITFQPAAANLNEGQYLDLRVTATSNAPLTYQWFKDGNPIPGAISAIFTKQAAGTDAGSYFVRVTSDGGSTDSATVAVTVASFAPRITSQPRDVGALVGGTATFSIVATGAPAPSYRWEVRWPGTSTWTVLSGNNPYYAFYGTRMADDGARVRCVVSNPYGEVVSDEAVLRLGTSAGVLRIAAGGRHSLVIRSDFSAWGTGANESGQLGNGTLTNRTAFTKGQIASRIWAGAATSFWRNSSDSIVAAGENSRGTLGASHTANVSVPSGFRSGVDVAAGHRHSFLLTYDGALRASGANESGQLGDGSRTDRAQYVTVADRVVSAAAGVVHSLFVRSDGTVWAMGANDDGQFGNGTLAGSIVPIQVGGGTQSVATHRHTLFLRRNGTLWAAGRNNRGQLGTGTTSSTSTPVQIASDVVSISVGAQHSLFLKADGTVWGMGANDRGQLGDTTTTDRTTPVMLASGIIAIAAGGEHSLLLKPDGSVWAAGANDAGQLGDGTTTDRTAWTLVMEGVLLTSGSYNNYVFTGSPIGRDHVEVGWNPHWDATYFEVWRGTTDDFSQASRIAARVEGMRYYDYTAQPGTTYRYFVRAVTGSASHLIGSATGSHAGTAPTRPVITGQPTDLVVTEGSAASFSVSATGTGTLRYFWRHNGEFIAGATSATLLLPSVDPGQAGDYDVLVVDTQGQTLSSRATLSVGPVDVSIDSASRTLDSLPRLYTVAVTSNGGWRTSSTVDWLSASPERGQGNGTVVLIADANLSGTPRHGVITIGGETHTVTQEGSSADQRKLWLVGADHQGQMAQGRHLTRSEPHYAFSGASRVAVAQNTTFFLRPNGELWFTGADPRDASSSNNPPGVRRDAPQLLATGVARVAAGETHLLLIKSDHTLWGLGYNTFGQLGLGSTGHYDSLQQIAIGVSRVATDNMHTLFVKTDGSVWAMGSGDYGRLGTGKGSSRYTPTFVAAGGVDVAVGRDHSALLKDDGSLWMTGRGDFGQLGTGNTRTVMNWVLVALNVAQVACGEYHTVFRRHDGQLWGMGRNSFGQLVGSTPDTLSPVYLAQGVAEAAATWSATYFVTTDGRLWIMGYDGQTSFALPSVVAHGVSRVAAYADTVAMLRLDGAVFTRGANGHGQLGARSLLRRLSPVLTEIDVREAALGPDFSVWLNASGEARGAGRTNAAQLGVFRGATSTPLGLMSDVRTIRAGDSHTLLLKTDGTLWGTGSNIQGQLGLDQLNSHALTQLQTGVLSMAAGHNTTYFLKDDDTLWGMGGNDSGQLGLGISAPVAPPTQLLTEVAAVAAGRSFTLVLRTDGSLWGAGFNGMGQLGLGTTNTQHSFTLIAQGVRAMSAGEHHSVWLKRDGTAWGAGSNYQGQLGRTGFAFHSPVQLGEGVVAVQACGDSTFLLKDGGEVWASGANSEAQLGDGTTTQRREFIRVGTGVLAVHPGPNSTAFIAPEGFVTAPQSPVITRQPASQAAPLASSVTLTVEAAGSPSLAYQWQRNGIDIPGATSASYTLDGLSEPALGFYSVNVANAVGSVSSEIAEVLIAAPPLIVSEPDDLTVNVGRAAGFSVVATGHGQTAYQWFHNGNLIEGATQSRLAFPAVLQGHAGAYSVVVTNPSGSTPSRAATLTVASLAAPQITRQPVSRTTGLTATTMFSVEATGTPPLTYQWQRLPAGSSNWVDVVEVLSPFYSGAREAQLHLLELATLLGNHGDRYRCVVANNVGSVASAEATLSVNPATAPIQSAHGYNHTAVLRLDGTVLATGRNQEGQLGDGSGAGRTSLASSSITGVIALAAGADHLLYLKQDGSLWASGYNEFGTLGTGNTANVGVPVQVATQVAAAAGGYRHTLVRKSDGTLWATGRNQSGQLGLGDTTQRNSLVQVATQVLSASAGNTHSLYVTTDRKAYAMGGNASGQLGDGTQTSRLSPVQVGQGYVAVAAGYNHSLFLGADGTLWASGSNSHGQLGDGTTTDRLAPVQVATSVVAMAAGFYHTVFLKSDGTAWATGRNDSGELGDATFVNRSTPVQIATGVAQIATGLHTTSLIMRDGTLRVTGLNDQGQLADGTTTNRGAFQLMAGGGGGLPGPIATLTASKSSASDRVTLLWTHASSVSHYRILRGLTDSAGDATTIADRVVGNYYQDLTGQPGVLYRYWVQAHNAYGTFGSGATDTGLQGVAAAPPAIDTPPQGQTVSVGTPVALSVVASGPGPLGYQWHRNGSPIADATAATLSLGNATLASAGDYTVVVSNPTGSVTSPVATLTVNRRPQTITFDPLPDRTYTTAPLTLAATATSGLPVAFTLVSGPAILQGTQLTLTGPGTVVLRTTQTGDDTYDPAPQVERSFSVGKAAASVSLASLSATYDGSAKSATATTTPADLPVVLTYDGAATTPTNAGSYAVNATVNHALYEGSASGTLIIAPAAQTITFAPLANRAFSLDPVPLSATSNSGLSVSFTLVAGAGRIAGANLLPDSPGTFTIRATQPGNGNYSAAPAVEQSFTVMSSLDSWALEHFSAEELLNPAISGPNADPDGDGLSNLLEYALGLDPRATGGELPALSVGPGELIYTYRRPAARSEITYTVQYSTNLTTWTASGVTHELVTSANGIETWRATVPSSAGPNLFLRLRVTR